MSFYEGEQVYAHSPSHGGVHGFRHYQVVFEPEIPDSAQTQIAGMI